MSDLFVIIMAVIGTLVSCGVFVRGIWGLVEDFMG